MEGRRGGEAFRFCSEGVENLIGVAQACEVLSRLINYAQFSQLLKYENIATADVSHYKSDAAIAFAAVTAASDSAAAAAAAAAAAGTASAGDDADADVDDAADDAIIALN